MRILFTLFLCLAVSSQIFSQSIEVSPTFSTSIRTTAKHGVNAAYLFHHFINSNGNIDASLKNEMVANNYDLMRFPGGAIGNYYNYDERGYGMIQSEVQGAANTIQCNSSGFYCFTKDESASRNFIHDFVDYLDYKYEATGKPSEVLFVLSILQHFNYNFNEIELLDNIHSLDDLNEAVTAGTISADFNRRILNNYNAYALLATHPNTKVVGVEFGNELYFSQEVTSFPYNITNSDPFFNLNNALEQLDPRITKIISLLTFYRKILSEVDSNVKIGIPIGNINHLGNMANVNKIWNIKLRDRVTPHVDAFISHFYIQTDGSNVVPPSVAINDNNSSMVNIRSKVFDFVNSRFKGNLNQINSFFNVEANGKRLWFTEYNVFKNESNTNIWDEWSNTYLHGVFLNKFMEEIAAGNDVSKLVDYAVIHGWSGTNNTYEHNLISRLTDGSTINRIAFFTNYTYDFFKSKHVRKLNGQINSTQNAQDLYTASYYTYDQISSDACPDEKLVLTVNNLRMQEIGLNLNFPNNVIELDNIDYNILGAKLKGYMGENTASACGKTSFNSSESNFGITLVEENEVDFTQTIPIEGYFSGVIELTIEPVIPTCLPLFVDSSIKNELTVYPNPAKNTIQINISENKSLLFSEVAILNTLGQVMGTFTISSEDERIDINHLESGMYYLSTQSNGEQYAGSFIKL